MGGTGSDAGVLVVRSGSSPWWLGPYWRHAEEESWVSVRALHQVSRGQHHALRIGHRGFVHAGGRYSPAGRDRIRGGSMARHRPVVSIDGVVARNGRRVLRAGEDGL